MFLLSPSLCLAQESIPYQRLLLLVAGPSSDHIDSTEQEVVSYLNQLRFEYELSNLQMGTMHFDRPREAELLKNTLGFSPAAGISVGLVQLSDDGIPSRTLYKRDNVNRSIIESEHKKLLRQWADLSQQNLPPAFNSATSTHPSLPNQPNPPETNPSATTLPPPQKKTTLTREGISTTISLLDQKIATLYDTIKNCPIRDDRMDIPLREATLKLSNEARLLRLAKDRGLVYPMQELRNVRAAGRAWRLAEPQYYLPVNQRNQAKPILELLDLVESIEAQGRENT